MQSVKDIQYKKWKDKNHKIKATYRISQDVIITYSIKQQEQITAEMSILSQRTAGKTKWVRQEAAQSKSSLS